MVEKYLMKFKSIDYELFKKMLWGDYYFDSQTKKFTRKSQTGIRKRAFV